MAAQRLGYQRGGPEGPEAHSANAGGVRESSLLERILSAKPVWPVPRYQGWEDRPDRSHSSLSLFLLPELSLRVQTSKVPGPLSRDSEGPSLGSGPPKHKDGRKN